MMSGFGMRVTALGIRYDSYDSFKVNQPPGVIEMASSLEGLSETWGTLK